MNKEILVCIFAFLISLCITVIIEKRLIPILSRKAAQPIYADGPSWHLSKSGTPTMGGIAFLVAISIVLGAAIPLLIFARGDLSSGISIILTLFFSIGNALIGILDDLVKLRKRENAGLSPKQKLVLQLLLALLFLMSRKFFFDDSELLRFSFGSIDAGFLYYLFALILILGTVNCANLTDGIDGLASSTASTVGIVYLIIGLFTSSIQLSLISATLIGGTIGFLLFNKHPAKIFMGDTGSLFLGALAVSMAFCSGNPITVIFIGGVYVLEGISVILQVAYYKLTGKRLFKMAPIHHHLEKNGISENKICLIAVLFTLLFSVLSFIVVKL